MDTGTFTEPSQQALRAYLKHWLDAAVRPRTSKRTHHDYAARLRLYVLDTPLAGKPLVNVTPADVQKLYSDMLARGLAPRSVQYLHAVLRSAFKQAVKWNLLAVSPIDRVQAPKVKRKEMQAFTPEEARRFLEAASTHRHGALYTLLLATGLRPGEGLALRWTDFDGDIVRVRRTLVYRAGTGIWFENPKTPRSRRSVPLPSFAARALREHRKRQAEEKLAAGAAYQDNGLIFASTLGAPVDPGAVSRAFRKIVDEAGLPHLRLYDLRHTAATLLLAAGENLKIVSERLGHSTITLTADVYAHVSETMQRQASEKMDRLLAGSDS